MAEDETVDDETPIDPPAGEPAPEEPVAEEPLAEAEEPPAPAEEEPPAEAEDAPAEEQPADGEGDPAVQAQDAPPAPPAPAVPQEIVHPKERRRRARQRSGAGPRPSLSPEEHKAERDERRAKNAKARTDRRRKLRERKPAGAKAAAAPPTARERATQKVRQGIVVSDKAAKTITVRIDTSRRHRRYQKIVRSSRTLHAHDENNEAHEGDLVRVIETRPLSATKRWRLAEVLERAR